MFDNFILRKTDKGNIAGYLWHVENPVMVVCIVHGIGEYGGRFDRVAEKFRENRIAVVSMDLRGHGLSLGKKGDCAPRADVLEDVSELIRYAGAKYPDVKIVLYGHSMGGNITLDYRARGGLNDQVCAYMISAPWIRLIRQVPKPLYKLVKFMCGIKSDLTMSSSVDEAILGNPLSVKPYADNPMVHNRISLQCAADGFDIGNALETGTNQSNGRADAIPTMIMHGEEDKICDIEGTKAMYEILKTRGENVEMICWPGLYHEIHNGGAESTGDEVIQRITEFVLEQLD